MAEKRNLIENSGLFDEDFYLKTYPDIKQAGVNPLDHYINHGGVEGRWPSGRFNGSQGSLEYFVSKISL